MAPRTRIVKIYRRMIASLAEFGLLAALNFQLFGMVTALKTIKQKNWSETCLWLHISQLERRICKERKDIFKLAEFMAFLTASYCLTLSAIEVDVLTICLSFEIRETMGTILYFIASIPLKPLLLPSGSHIVSCFSARAEIPFRLHEIFSDFLAHLPGAKRARIFSQGWIALRAESLSM